MQLVPWNQQKSIRKIPLTAFTISQVRTVDRSDDLKCEISTWRSLQRRCSPCSWQHSYHTQPAISSEQVSESLISSVGLISKYQASVLRACGTSQYWCVIFAKRRVRTYQILIVLLCKKSKIYRIGVLLKINRETADVSYCHWISWHEFLF